MSPEKPLVLVVSAERVVADTLAIILLRDGYRIAIAYSGERALAVARERQPWLLLSPNIDELRTVLCILEEQPNCKVVLFSGNDVDAKLIESARQQGYKFEVLAAPVNPRDLLIRLGKLRDQQKKIA
jgi:CheY-like chemotaxis protein